MEHNYLVSIIIPVYNAEKYIEKCVRSILENTLENVEILLIDDGSTDNSLQLIRQFRSDSVKIFHHENHGVSYTRNFGIQQASGSYIVFVDSDDFIDNHYLETLYDAAVGFDVGISGINFVDKNYVPLAQRKSSDTSWNKFYLPLSGGKIYNRHFLIENNLFFSDLKIGEDLVFNTKNYALTNKVVNIDYIGYNYVENEQSITHSTHHSLDSFALVSQIQNNIKSSNYIKKSERTFFLSKTLIDTSFYGLSKNNLSIQAKNIRKGFIELNLPMVQYNKYESLPLNFVVNFFSLFSYLRLPIIPLKLMGIFRKN